MDKSSDLPPLPLAAVATSAYSRDSAMRLFYTTDQMQAYARAAVEAEREAIVSIIETYRVPIGNSSAGEMAAEWTTDALKEIRDAIRARGKS